jgi:ZIP family zinc transporter
VFVPVVVAVSAVGLGLLLGLAPAGVARIVGPLRTFALTTALAVAGTHLLPEAFHELGAIGLAVFALGLSLPSMLRLVRGLRPHGGSHGGQTALEFGYAGLLVHLVADGLGLGAYGAGEQLELDVLLALAVHTVPLVAVVTLAYRDASGTRAAVWRSLGLAAASLMGIAVSVAVSPEQAHEFEAWVAAAVAGLLVHVVTHDLDRDLPSSAPARVADALAAVAGIAVSLAAAHEEPLGLLSGASRLLEIVSYTTPPLVLAMLLAAAVDKWLPLRPGWALLSLRRSLLLREHPERLRALPRRQAYAQLALAFAIGFDAILISLWLAGPMAEGLRLTGALALALGVASLLRSGSHVATPVPESAAEHSFLSLFVDAVARTSPWLVTSLLLAAVLDSSLGPQALAPQAGPWLSIVVVSLLALPVQVDAAAAAPLLALLVHHGLPAGAAVAGWVVIAAPGESSLLALLGRKSGAIALMLGATLLAGVAVGSGVELLGVTFAPLVAGTLAESLGLPAALVFGVTVAYVIWKRGLRGWLGSVLSHEH